MEVGQKVMCIKAGAWSNGSNGYWFCSKPVYGEVYTIRDIIVTSTGTYLRLYEIVNNYPNEPSFNAREFVTTTAMSQSEEDQYVQTIKDLLVENEKLTLQL